MKKKILAALCAAILLLGLALQAAAAGEDWDANVIFLGLNDSPMPLQRQHHAHPGGRDHLCPLHHLCGQSERRDQAGRI